MNTKTEATPTRPTTWSNATRYLGWLRRPDSAVLSHGLYLVRVERWKAQQGSEVITAAVLAASSASPCRPRGCSPPGLVCRQRF